MSKIGIMGGTFNPIHNGHIGIAKAAYQQYHLDKVYFMPNHLPAYKKEKEILSGNIRMEMIELAICDIPYFFTSDYELNRTGKTYTYETFSSLSLDYPENSFYFIMGADSLFYFEHWKHPEIIVRHAKILIAVRDSVDMEGVKEKIAELSRIFGDNIFFPIQSPDYDCSSSKIREAVSNNLDVSLSVDEFASQYDIPEKVYLYMKEKNLYRNNTM